MANIHKPTFKRLMSKTNAKVDLLNLSYGSNPDAILQEAYDQALQYFEQELARNDDDRTWVRQYHSIADVAAITETAKTLYLNPGGSVVKKEAQRWTIVFSERILFYGNVLDLLSQHHPEYVALVWGATKFVLQGIVNHAEIVSEFTKALSEVALALPLVEANARLYPSEHMRGIVARVYGLILIFMRRAVKWYCKGSFHRALSSIVKPWSLVYQDTVEEIRSLSKSVNAIGNVAAGAELRGLTVSLEGYDVKLDTLNLQMDQTMALLNQVLDISKHTNVLSQGMSIKIDENLIRLRDLQFVQILTTLKPRRVPDEVLNTCMAIARRRKLQTIPHVDPQSVLADAQRWVSSGKGQLFVLRAGPRAEATTKDLALEITALLRSLSLRVFWFFSERSSFESEPPGFSAVYKSLIYQILSSNTDVLQGNDNLINAAKFQSLSEPELQDLLVFLLLRLPGSFLVVETQSTCLYSNDQQPGSQEFENVFQSIIDKAAAGNVTIKVLIISYERSLVKDINVLGTRIERSIYRSPLPLTKARRRLNCARTRALHQGSQM